MMPLLVPRLSTYRPDEPIMLDLVDAEAAGPVWVFALGDLVHESAGHGHTITVPALPPGGYGIEVHTTAGTLRTAVDVTGDPRSRLRYGFVVDFRPDRDTDGFLHLVRRLHLTGIQFYDWAYRHADLLGGGEDYADALGQPVSLGTVRRLIDAAHLAGADALGYAAVYGVGNAEWPTWQHDALLTATGVPYGLGDFLQLVDPAAPDWSAHFRADLRAAAESVGFDGFHLDQYGYPKVAVRTNGTVVQAEDSFVELLEQIHRTVPGRMVFNNVNDFPTWRTTTAPQSATYVEVWPPHDTLDALADVVVRARALAPDRPTVVAAYQHVYDATPADIADRSTALTMATLFSHGATQLLVGEADRLLIDPYYVRNHPMASSTLALLARWYDFLVEHGTLLMDPRLVEVTGSFSGDYNGDLDVAFADHAISGQARPDVIWRRIVRTDAGLVVHLINLLGQSDVRWDAPRSDRSDSGPGIVRVRRVGSVLPRIQVADPDRTSRLVDLDVQADGDHAVAALPELAWWQVLRVDLAPEMRTAAVAVQEGDR